MDRCTHVYYAIVYLRPLFTSVIQSWGPRASPLIIRCTTHLDVFDSVSPQAGPNPDGFVQVKGRPPRLSMDTECHAGPNPDGFVQRRGRPLRL
eukprot:2526424-Pyramimonas_sp.AAC.1